MWLSLAPSNREPEAERLDQNWLYLEKNFKGLYVLRRTLSFYKAKKFQK